MELYRGRPEDVSGRLEREVRSYDLLDSLGMTYWRTDHQDMPAGNMEACNEVDAVLGVLICKNLFLCNRQRTSFYLLLMPGDKPFKTKELSAQINSSRLSFGSAEEMEELLGVSPGSVSVLGLMNDRERRVRLLVDEDADDILRAISDRYLAVNCSVMTPNDARIDNTAAMARAYRADGVVEVVLQACHTFNVESSRVQRRMEEEGIPYLKLETDYSAGDGGQVGTRLAAFIEML